MATRLRRKPADVLNPARSTGTRGQVRRTLSTTARLTVAGVLAYLLTLWLTSGPVDLTGALTALLVVQTSAFSTLRMGIVRVGAVLTGVLVAVALSSWVGLTWWSLAMVIAASLLLAAALRLGEQALETPISAMLILGVGGQEIAAETRVVTTLIGAAVGIALNLLVPPRVPTGDAIADVRAVSLRQAECLAAASVSMERAPITKAQVGAWLDQVEKVRGLALTASASVGAMTDARRFNPRAIGTSDPEPTLRDGLRALERSSLAMRALFVVMRKEAPETENPDDGYGEEVRAAFSLLLRNVAECVDAFGSLVLAETTEVEADVERTLTESLDVEREARALLTELLFVDAREEPSLWLLRGSILLAVEQVVEPLRLEDRARVRRERELEPWRAWRTTRAGLLADAVRSDSIRTRWSTQQP